MILRTEKQQIIMDLILKAADEGRFYNVTELHQALPYTCAYGSLRTSLRFLRRHGMIVNEKAGNFNLLRPTSKAYSFFRRIVT